MAQILSVCALLFALILEISWKSRVMTHSFWIVNKQEILEKKSAPHQVYDGYQCVGMVGPFFSWWDHVLTRDCVIFSSRPSWFTAYWWPASLIPWYPLISYTSQIIFRQKWCWRGQLKQFYKLWRKPFQCCALHFEDIHYNQSDSHDQGSQQQVTSELERIL